MAQKIGDKAVSTHTSTIQFVSECYKTLKIRDKAVNRYFFVYDSIPDWYKTQEMFDRVVSEDYFLIVYYPDKYKTQKLCDEAVDDCLSALKCIPNWFVTNKTLEKFDNALHANYDILFYNEDFGKFTIIANQRRILAMDLDKTYLDIGNNFDEDDLDSIIHVRLLAWRSKFEKRK